MMPRKPVNIPYNNKYIHYYIPNTELCSVTSLFGLKNKHKYIEQYFQEYSQKKYILITFSGRSALYLAYKAIGIKGEVITSPLTCLTAILPMIHAGNKPIFNDINPNTLTMDNDNLSVAKSAYTIAIQPIHFGGIPCDMDKIVQFAQNNNLYVIEDCAQGFGAEINDHKVGTLGDISVFSLAKNLYGFSGGIIATDNKSIYDKAKRIQNSFPTKSVLFFAYRYLRNLLKSSNGSFSDKLYFSLMNLKGAFTGKNSDDLNMNSLCNYLRKPSRVATTFSWHQIGNLENLHKKRKRKAKQLCNILKSIKGITIPDMHEDIKSSFVKIYVYSPQFDDDFIVWMNHNGIEVKHLEEEYNVFYQKRFDRNRLFKDNASLDICDNYLRIHDRLASIPLHEKMTDQDFYFIRDKIGQYISNK